MAKTKTTYTGQDVTDFVNSYVDNEQKKADSFRLIELPKHSGMNKSNIIYTSIITCPVCSFQKSEEMPRDSCTYFYNCESCDAQLKPLKGDCCVYCSYGTVKCPPKQVLI